MTNVTQSALAVGLELAARQASASRRLHEALIAGAPTASIRQETADVDKAITQLAADQAQHAAEEDARQAEQIAAGAEVLAADAKTRVDGLMAALAIPPAPSGALH